MVIGRSASARKPPPWEPSGLVKLARVHAGNNAGDAMVAVSLAGTLFFSVPIGEARGRVALYLLTTMAPFAIVAPVIGPALDHVRSGRRYAIAATMLARAVVAWFMAGGGGLRLYPAAFAVLVLGKGYGLARAAAVPRLLPADQSQSLVGANARLSATGVIASSLAASIGAGLSALLGFGWTLRLAAVIYAVATVFALRLPDAVNSAPEPAGGGPRGVARFPANIRSALLGAVALKALAGYLTIFLAFLLKQGGGGSRDLGIVVGAAAVGGMSGTGFGMLLRRRAPEALLSGALIAATLGCLVAARSFNLGTAAFVAILSGLGGGLGKLAYDAMLQRDIVDELRGQTFARSETTLQLAWVVGGGLGIAVPSRGGLGLGVAALAMVVAAVPTVGALVRAHRAAGHRPPPG